MPSEESRLTLDYAAADTRQSALVLTRGRAIVFILIAASPMLWAWPAVSLLGDYGLVLSGLLILFSLATTFLAIGVVLAWQWARPIQIGEHERYRRRWKRSLTVVGVIALSTPTGLPTRAILIAHVPLFSIASRDVIPSSPVSLAQDTRYAGIYRVHIDTSRGGISFKTDPWWGWGADDGIVAWDEFGDRRMVWNTAGEGTLIGRWIWWDLE